MQGFCATDGCPKLPKPAIKRGHLLCDACSPAIISCQQTSDGHPQAHGLTVPLGRQRLRIDSKLSPPVCHPQSRNVTAETRAGSRRNHRAISPAKALFSRLTQADRKAALMYQTMMVPAEPHQIVEAGLAAIGPVDYAMSIHMAMRRAARVGSVVDANQHLGSGMALKRMPDPHNNHLLLKQPIPNNITARTKAN